MRTISNRCTLSESHEETMPKEKESRLERAINKTHAEKGSLHVETELLKSQVADLKKSQSKLQQTKAKLKVTVTEMTGLNSRSTRRCLRGPRMIWRCHFASTKKQQKVKRLTGPSSRNSSMRKHSYGLHYSE